MPPDRGNNALQALSLLGHGEFILFRMNWYIPPASENSRLLRELFWKIEELQKGLEEEVLQSCQRITDKVVED